MENIPHPFGGHLPYPPADCPFKHNFFIHCGVVWIDASICHVCEKMPCERRKEWKKNTGITYDKNPRTL